MPSSPHQAIPESINNANKKRACTDLSSGSIESSVEVRTYSYLNTSRLCVNISIY